MHRRDFFKTSVQAAAAGGVMSVASHSCGAAVRPAGESTAPAVLRSYTASDHRRRLENIGVCHLKIRECMRKHLVSDYLPAQCCYNLGEYPCVQPWDPDEYDEQELDRLREHGIQLIQLFDESNDSLRLFGGHKLTPFNPEGLRRFVDMAHQRGIKVITYISTGYWQYKDRDCRPEWYRPKDGVTMGYWDYGALLTSQSRLASVSVAEGGSAVGRLRSGWAVQRLGLRAQRHGASGNAQQR